MNQQDRVLNYLKQNGSINPLISLMELSVYRLSDTIFKLRENHNIETDKDNAYLIEAMEINKHLPKFNLNIPNIEKFI